MNKIHDLFNNQKRLASATMRFWKYTIKAGENDCWLWNSKQVNEHGYGFLSCSRGVIIKSHRLSYSLFLNRPVENSEIVMHTCDNPRCVNPNHLRIGTQAENILDSIKKGRNSKPPIHFGEDHHNAKFSSKDRLDIVSDKRTHNEIAKDYGVCSETIGRIKRNQTWKLSN